MVLEFLDSLFSFEMMGSEFGLGSIILSALFMLIGFVIARIVKVIFGKKFAPKMPEHTAKNVGKFLYYGIILIAFGVVITSQGIDLGGLVIAGGIFGVVMGFATQSVVSNLISGFFLMIEKPLKQGDTVQLPDLDILGTVLDITMFSTKIRKFDGTILRIPNDKVFTSRIREFTTIHARRLSIPVGIAYDSDVKKTIHVIKNAIKKSMPFVLRRPEPQIHVTELADNSVNLEVLVWHHKDDWTLVYPEVLNVIKMALDEAGIEIPFPQRVITYTDKN
ncbi:MAG: mechanosensitive ion channel family protein [Nitrosopumilus sp.]|nr:mechanosensitive ion channel family protein [Nitrosopumilus sp.]